MEFSNKKEHLIAVSVYFAFCLIFFKEILLQTHWFGEDFFTQNYPNRVFASDELRRGNFPLWNPFSFSGAPFFADVQTAVLYPPNFLMSFWSLKGVLGYYALEIQTIFHFFAGAWFMFAYLRLSGIIFLGALLGGTLFAFGGYWFNHAHHSNFVDSGIWLPAVFYCCLRSFCGNSIWIFGCPTIMTMALLAGHPQLALFIFYLFTSYYFYLVWREKLKFKKAIENYLIVSVLFALMAMVQILPLVEFLMNTQRQSLGYEGAVKDSLPFEAIWTFLFSELGNSFYEPWQQWEFRCYFGLGGLALAILGSLRNKIEPKFFAAIAAISLVLAFGNNTPVYKWFYHCLPGLKFVRVPARFLFPFIFCISILAAHGISLLVEGAQANKLERARLRKYILGLAWILITSGIGAVFWFDPAHPGLKAHLVVYLILTTLLMFALLGSIHKKRGLISQTLLLVIIVADLFIFRGGFCLTSNSKEKLSFMLESNPIAQIAGVASENDRIQMQTAFPLFKNYGMVHRVVNTSGYNPFTLAVYSTVEPFIPEGARFMGVRYIDFNTIKQLVKQWKGLKEIQVQNGFFVNDNAGPRAFMTANYEIDPDCNLRERFKKDTFDPYEVVCLNKKPEKESSEVLMKYKIENYKNAEEIVSLSTRNSAPGLLVTTEIDYPGWQAFVNNKRREILRAYGAFRAVYVDSTKATIKFEFHPLTFYLGGWISLLTFLGLCVFLISRNLNKRKFCE